jgi:hypothetical protein
MLVTYPCNRSDRAHTHRDRRSQLVVRKDARNSPRTQQWGELPVRLSHITVLRRPYSGGAS